jgi:hypothetical protein
VPCNLGWNVDPLTTSVPALKTIMSRRAVLSLLLVAYAAQPLSAQSRFLFGSTGGRENSDIRFTANGTVVVPSVSRGWYDQTGATSLEQSRSFLATSYQTGFVGRDERRGFMVFRVPSEPSPVTSLTISLLNCGPAIPGCEGDNGFQSPNATETFDLFDVSTDVEELFFGRAGVSGFTDLGTGTRLGSFTASSADNGQFVNVSLNADGIAAFNAARSSRIGLGIALRPTTVVPEPSTYALTAACLTALMVLSRRRRP